MNGSLAIMDASGHVGISWSNTAIDIDLNPIDNPKANEKERSQVLKLINESMDKGFVCTIDGKPAVAGELPKTAKKIKLTMNEISVKDMMTKLFNSEVLSNHLLFKIDASGKGELIQSSEFTIDGEYQATKPLAGG